MNTHDIPGNHFHTDIEYAFVAQNDPNAAVEEGESNDLRWLSQVELDSLPSTDIFDSTKDVYHFLLDEVLPNWDTVPTSEFLLTLPKEYIK